MPTVLSPLGLPITSPGAIPAKAPAGSPMYGTRIGDFDTWQPGYGGMTVEVLEAGTTTKATLYSNALLGTQIPNPQVLLSKEDENGDLYGKWAQPVYVTVPYFLNINNTDNTGIERPAITELAGQDGSGVLVSSSRGRYQVVLQDITDLVIHAQMFGQISDQAGSALSTATLNAAIGAAAAQGAGHVFLPGEGFAITPATVATGVVLHGHGVGATILRCQETGAIVTIGGDGGGLEDLALDGINVVGGSIGVCGEDISQAVMRNATVQRFGTGIKFQGVSAALWHNLQVSGCTRGMDLLGDSAASGDGLGAEMANVEINGGSVALCTEYGMQVKFVDLPARELTVNSFGFVSNVGPALNLVGVRRATFNNCYWTGNTANLSISDGIDANYADLNTTDLITFNGGQMVGGTLTFNQTCSRVVFRGVEFQNCDFILSVPANEIILIDCTEDSACTVTGDTKKLRRISTVNTGEVYGVTTDANPTTAWQQEMRGGEVGLFIAEIIAIAQNAITFGVFHLQAGAYRPGSTLAFISQTGNYTAGLIVTGATSGASARITAVTQAAGSGTLTLREVSGTFISGELLTDTSTGSANASGSISTGSVSLDSGGTGVLRADVTTGSGWDAVFAVSGSMMTVVITGEAAKTIDWTVRVRRLVP